MGTHTQYSPNWAGSGEYKGGSDGGSLRVATTLKKFHYLQTLPAVEFGPDKDLWWNCDQSFPTMHCCHGYTDPKPEY